MNSHISGVDKLGWSLEVPWFREHVPSWPKQAEPGFPPKGTSFSYYFACANPCLSISVLWLSTKTAATWQNVLQPLHPCRHNTALYVQQDTHLALSLDVLYSSHLHYWAEILKRFLIPTEEHEQQHLLLKSISLRLVRRTPTSPEEWNVKLIQRRISLLVNILNWHNQPKIHCLNVRKWQIK